jgi:hypothetical protein
MHGPDESILVREFLNAIAIISFHLHRLKKVFVDHVVSEASNMYYDYVYLLVN